MNVQDRFGTANVALSSRMQQPEIGAASFGSANAGTVRAADGIRRLQPMPATACAPAAGGGFGGMTGIIQALLSVITQLLSALGLGGLGNPFSGPQGNEQFFQTANGGSVGDPHLSFNGTTPAGGAVQSRFDSMGGHSDLLDSDSYAGGYQVSTAATNPAANGVTWNERATVSTNFGATQVSLDKSGNATIAQNGVTVSLADGQSVDLGNGESVSRAANGSLTISDVNGMGGSITTTLSDDGQGVDVSSQAAQVDLGGDLLNQPLQSSGTLQQLDAPARRYRATLQARTA